MKFKGKNSNEGNQTIATTNSGSNSDRAGRGSTIINQILSLGEDGTSQ